jgi:protein TonB
MKAIKTLLICFLLQLTPSLLKGQTIETKKIYLDNSLSEVDSSNATFYKLIDFLGNDSLMAKVKIHYTSGALYSITEYSNYPKFIKNGLATRFHNTGKIKSEIEYQNNNYHGKLKTFYESGQLKRNENYLNGKLIDSRCYSLDGKDTTNYPYEVAARYPGGENALMKYLSTNIKYPNKARRKGIEGVVYIKFIVTNLGEIEKCKIIKSVDPLLDNEAMRVVAEMGKWIPAELDGEKNSMSFTLPIKFKLQ